MYSVRWLLISLAYKIPRNNYCMVKVTWRIFLWEHIRGLISIHYSGLRTWYKLMCVLPNILHWLLWVLSFYGCGRQKKPTRLQLIEKLLLYQTFVYVKALPRRAPGEYTLSGQSSVADTDPNPGPDPHVFGPPGSGSGSISQKYRTGSGSFFH